LIRLTRDARGIVSVDATGVAPGRGAYVCDDARCAEQALTAAKLSRAFRKRSEAAPGAGVEVRALRSPGGRSARPRRVEGEIMHRTV
jgi:predicted RNA-binding protein YlxR (DUF448 family)